MKPFDSSGQLPAQPEAPPPAQPIAIVGMACRFPGAEDLGAFWRLLEAGENGVTEGLPGSGIGRVGELIPDAEVQSEACRFGGYLDRIDLFDAPFFRISPIEADLLDPQQRLMLEKSWRALEDAGMDSDRLKGSRTGVYAGISNHDYRSLILAGKEITEPAASLYAVSGTSSNTAIGRVAFALGLEGPAMALDTACSSSLVAIHQTVSALQQGEADLALAGGVHLILSGRLSELRAKAGMLAPDGRCKSFDAAANGYVWGVRAVVSWSSSTCDRRKKTATVSGGGDPWLGGEPGWRRPRTDGPERGGSGACDRGALTRAGVLPVQVDYLEAHGTGTEVGDPIELEAAAAAYGKGRAGDCPLLIGSVKTNIGHLEPAAGVAALVKVVLAMNHGVIPRHLHFRDPNPQVDWNQLPLQVTSAPTDWPLRTNRPRAVVMAPPGLAFVSSMTGRLVESGEALDEAYWQRPERETAAFDRGVETLAELGGQVVVEIGPDAVLGPLLSQAWPESTDDAGVSVVLSSLYRESQEVDGFVEAVAAA